MITWFILSLTDVDQWLKEIKMDKNVLKENLDKTIRVVFFTHYSLLYGANRSLLNLIDGLRDYPVRPYVIAPTKGDITDILEEREINYAVVPSAWWASSKPSFEGSFAQIKWQELKYNKKKLQRLKENIKSLKPLREQMEVWKPDIIYTNSSVLPVGFMVASLEKIPHIWHLREFIDLDFNFDLDIGSRASRLVINQSTSKISISNSIHNHFFGAGKKSGDHIIYNGVLRESDFDRYYQHSQSQKKMDGDAYCFTLVGKIQPNKGQEDAVRAISHLAKQYSVRLVLAGGGSDKNIEKIKILITHLGLENHVEILGHIDDPFKAYLAADAVLMCSKNEAMGRVTAEAMAACRPVIGYDNAGTSELIENEKTGLLYRGNDVELAHTMEKLILSPEWGRSLGHEGWKLARQRFSTETYSRQVFEVLASVAEQRKK